jgi:hypothetical protein
MFKKLAKIKYLPNNFEVINNGDHVICSVSGKQILLENLTYWNVEFQEAYFSYVEASQKRELDK